MSDFEPALYHGCKMGQEGSPQSLSEAFHAGRADYFGLAVNRAARFMGAAVGGQVLAERGVVEEVASIWASSGRKTHGYLSTPGG